MHNGNDQRVALVGCGRQMRNNLLPFLRRVPGHRVVACVDLDAEATEAARRLSGADRVATSVEDLDPGSIDAAIIALPPRESTEIAGALLERGIHCFVEKPGGWGPSDIAETREIAVRRGAHAQVGFNFRFTDALRALRDRTEELRQRPSMVTIDFLSRHPSGLEWGRTTLEAWIRHNGVHALDMARWLLPAPVVDVSAHAIRQGPDQFLSTIALTHADGSLSVVRVGNRTERFVVAASVQGDDGTRVTMPSLERVVCEHDRGTPSGTVLHSMSNLDHGWGRSGFGPELEAFLRHCQGEQDTDETVPTLGDALAAAELCDQVMDDLLRRDGEPSGADDPSGRVSVGVAGG